MSEEPANCSLPNRSKPPKRDPPLSFSTLHIKSDPQQKGDESPKESKSPACPCCNQAHPLYRCSEFKRKSVPERYEVVKRFKMCFNCLKQGHQVNECSNKTHCQVANCKRHHHTLLHYERAPQQLPSQDPQIQPSRLQTTPSRTWQPPTPSPPMTEWFISKLSQLKYKVKTGWQ